jgi:hypothetical protein
MPSAHSHAEAERKHSPASRLLRILCEAQILVSMPILRILCRAQILIITQIHCRSRLAGEPDLRYANAASEHMQSTHGRAAEEHMESTHGGAAEKYAIRPQPCGG